MSAVLRVSSADEGCTSTAPTDRVSLLPAELRDSIYSFLGDQTCATLSQVNTSFQRECLPLAYNHVNERDLTNLLGDGTHVPRQGERYSIIRSHLNTITLEIRGTTPYIYKPSTANMHVEKFRQFQRRYPRLQSYVLDDRVSSVPASISIIRGKSISRSGTSGGREAVVLKHCQHRGREHYGHSDILAARTNDLFHSFPYKCESWLSPQSAKPELAGALCHSIDVGSPYLSADPVRYPSPHNGTVLQWQMELIDANGTRREDGTLDLTAIESLTLRSGDYAQHLEALSGKGFQASTRVRMGRLLQEHSVYAGVPSLKNLLADGSFCSSMRMSHFRDISLEVSSATLPGRFGEGSFPRSPLTRSIALVLSAPSDTMYDDPIEESALVQFDQDCSYSVILPQGRHYREAYEEDKYYPPIWTGSPSAPENIIQVHSSA